jgi:hypothetical protein
VDNYSLTSRVYCKIAFVKRGEVNPNFTIFCEAEPVKLEVFG